MSNTCFPRPMLTEEPGVLSTFRTPCKPAAAGAAGCVWVEGRPATASRPLSVPRVSRLLADAHTVLGAPRAHRMLASLRQLMPTLRAARGAGEKAGPMAGRAGPGSEHGPASTCWAVKHGMGRVSV